VSLPFVKIELQQGVADCGITALAMLLGRSYLDVLTAAITKKHPRPHQAGMHTRQVQAVAKRLGVSLVLRRSWDLEASCGLLSVEKMGAKPDEFNFHMVLLKFGLIFDTDGTVWEPDDYFQTEKFRPVSLLVEQED
jgi:hypothetical protein